MQVLTKGRDRRGIVQGAGTAREWEQLMKTSFRGKKHGLFERQEASVVGAQPARELGWQMMAENQAEGRQQKSLQVLENICSLLQDKENHSRASPREGDIIQFSCPPYLGIYILFRYLPKFRYLHPYLGIEGFPGGPDGKASACNAGAPGPIPGWGFPGEGNAIHSNILAWKIPWTEETGRLQSMGSQRVGHD